jgi:hypothetical protein
LGEQPPPAEATINMILAKVGAQNLKGATFQHQLGPCVAIQGPNFSGKTAIFEAIRLAILGHIPEVGKLPKATWELASGDRMSVRVTFDNGGSITRVFQEGKTPIVSQDEAELFDLPMLNDAHYFGLPDSERTNYVFRHVRLPAVYTPESIIARARAASRSRKSTRRTSRRPRLRTDQRRAAVISTAYRAPGRAEPTWSIIWPSSSAIGTGGQRKPRAR